MRTITITTTETNARGLPCRQTLTDASNPAHKRVGEIIRSQEGVCYFIPADDYWRKKLTVHEGPGWTINSQSASRSTRAKLIAYLNDKFNSNMV